MPAVSAGNDPAASPVADVPLPDMPVGTVVVDECSQRVGEVRDREGAYVQLRPLRGGREWDADPSRVRVATPAERLAASVAAANAASRQGRK